MRDLRELNINEGGRPVGRPAPSQSDIEDFQREFGVTLPRTLLELLGHSNGGHPEIDSFYPDGDVTAYGWSVNRFHHLTADRDSTEGMWWNMQTWRQVLGNDALPIANTGGGDVFFLDLRFSPAPVCVTVHDEDFRIVTLSPSLEAFLEQLTTDPDNI